MTDDLREKLAEALYEDANANNTSRSSRLWKNAFEERELYLAKADAVLPVIQPHLDALKAERDALWLENKICKGWNPERLTFVDLRKERDVLQSRLDETDKRVDYSHARGYKEGAKDMHDRTSEVITSLEKERDAAVAAKEIAERHWVEDDRDLNALIARCEKAEAVLRLIASGTTEQSIKIAREALSDERGETTKGNT